MLDLNWPEERVLSTAINLYMEYIVLRHDDFLKRNLEDKNITLGDLTYLINISYSEGLSQKELADMLFVSEASVTKILKKLEKKGFIKRVVSVENNSKKLIYLTNEGRLLVENLNQLNHDWESELCSVLSQEEINALKHVLYILAQRSVDVLS